MLLKERFVHYIDSSVIFIFVKHQVCNLQVED